MPVYDQDVPFCDWFSFLRGIKLKDVSPGHLIPTPVHRSPWKEFHTCFLVFPHPSCLLSAFCSMLVPRTAGPNTFCIPPLCSYSPFEKLPDVCRYKTLYCPLSDTEPSCSPLSCSLNRPVIFKSSVEKLFFVW